MSTKLSVEEVLANLERRAADHREQEAFHAQREAHHREQRALHGAELEAVLMSLESFRAVAATAIDLVRIETQSTPAQPETEAPAPPVQPIQEDGELPPPGRSMVSRLLRQIAMSPSLAEPFGPKAGAEEANRRFGDRLPGPVGTRTASDVLRQMRAEGLILLVREGKAVQEALYTRRERG